MPTTTSKPTRRVRVNDSLGGPAPLQTFVSRTQGAFQPSSRGTTGAAPSGTNPYLELAYALRGIKPSLDRYFQNEQQAYTEEEQLKATEFALTNREGFNKLIRKGEIPEGASPWFVAAAMARAGKVEGQNYDQLLRTQWQQSPVRDSDDPAEFEEFLQEHREALLNESPNTQNALFLQNFNNQAALAENNLRQQHTAYRRKVLEETARENLAQDARYTLQAPSSSAARGEAITRMLDEWVANGGNGSDGNTIVATQIINEAKRTLDPSLLGVLKQIKSGKVGASKRPTLGDIPYIQDEIAKASEQIVTDIYKLESFDRQREQQERTQLSARMVQDNVPILSDLSIPDGQIASLYTQAQLVDPTGTLRKTMSSFRDSIRELSVKEFKADPQRVAEVTNQVYAGQIDPVTLMNMVGTDIDLPTFNSLRAKLADAEGRSVMRHPEVTNAIGLLKDIIAEKGPLGNIIRDDGAKKFLKAQAEFKNIVYAQIQAGVIDFSANYTQSVNQITQIAETIGNRYSSSNKRELAPEAKPR